MCGSDWAKEDADVLCREINCGSPVTQAEVLYFGQTRAVGGIKTSCAGNESSLAQCKLQEFKENCVDATIVCSSKSAMCSNYS